MCHHEVDGSLGLVVDRARGGLKQVKVYRAVLPITRLLVDSVDVLAWHKSAATRISCQPGWPASMVDSSNRSQS